MASTPATPIALTLRVETFPIGEEGVLFVNCPSCGGGALEIHEPSSHANGGRLLGTCGRCDAWVLIEESADGNAAYLITLPRREEWRPAAEGGSGELARVGE